MRDRLADERDPVGKQESAGVGRLEPGVVSIGQRAVDNSRGRNAVYLQVGNGAKRPAKPVRALGGTTQSASRRLGVDEGGGRMRRGAQGCGNALGAHDDGEDGLLAATGTGDCSGHFAGRCAHCRNE